MFKVNQTKINPSTIELLLTGFVFYLVRQINNVFAYKVTVHMPSITGKCAVY